MEKNADGLLEWNFVRHRHHNARFLWQKTFTNGFLHSQQNQTTNARFKAKTQTARHAGVAGFIPHRGTTLSCVFIADIKSYRLSRCNHNARTNSSATDIKEKVRIEGKDEKIRGK